MYRTGDPRFRRRLNEIGHTLETANESAQSSIYIFAQTYVRPCLGSVTSCFTTCVDAGCPTLNLSQRDRARRQRGRARSRGRAELSFDFYDDWDEEESDALLGWGNDEFDHLLAGSGGGYGTVGGGGVQQQPARQRGMSYPKGRQRSAGQLHEGTPGGWGFWGRLFGGKGKGKAYKPSAADLQEHPGARRPGREGPTEGEALLREGEAAPTHRRARSGTAGSGETVDSLSSRGDIFPSDEEDDAIPLDDEFAMVLERRHSAGGSGPETESSSGKTRSPVDRKRGKRPSTGSKRTPSSRSVRSARKTSRQSSAAQTPIEEVPRSAEVPTLTELKQEERLVEREEEADVEQRRLEAQTLASERGLAGAGPYDLSSKEATPTVWTPEEETTPRKEDEAAAAPVFLPSKEERTGAVEDPDLDPKERMN